MSNILFLSTQQIKSFKEKLAILKSQLQKSNGEMNNKNETITFISLGWKTSRAHVFVGIGNTFESSWKQTQDQSIKYLKNKKRFPEWIKADVVTDQKRVLLSEINDVLTVTKKNYFRYGISFDSEFKLAFLEQEINANGFIKYEQKYQKAYLDEQNINYYLTKYRNTNFSINFKEIRDIILFRTKSFIYDGDCYELKSSFLDNGRRKIHNLKANSILDIIDYSSQTLSELIQEDGRFVYGYFACFNEKMNHYNIREHASTVYSMIKAYELTRNKQLIKPIKRALNFLNENANATFYSTTEDPYAYVMDEQNDQDIKLGVNASFILAFSKYIKVFQDEQYLKITQNLARGIEKMQKEDGSFVHVLNYPHFKVKETFRTVCYDGQATFALIELYEIDRNIRWLKTVEKAYNYFIENEYWKYHDHYLGYSTTELIKYQPKDTYFNFGLKNAFCNLDVNFNRETTYPTFLELITTAYKMIRSIKTLHKQHLLEEFDEDKLIEAIHHRADYQLNSYFYPEISMYFKRPYNLLNSFFNRHRSFRTRIDDTGCNLSGYCNYLTYFLMENGEEEKIENEIS